MRDITFSDILIIVKRLMVLNAVFLALMTVCRLAFGLYYGDLPVLLPLYRDVLRALVLGIRFDLVVVSYVNGLVTLSLLLAWLAGRRRFLLWWLNGVKFYYAVMFALVMVTLSIDFGFYSYFKSHINILIFGIFEDDTRALFSTLAENYNLPLVGAGFAALIGLVCFICHRGIRGITGALALPGRAGEVRAFRWWHVSGFAVLLVSLNVVAARGSFGLFPLGTMDAEISRDTFINKLAINGIFTLQEAIEYRMKENNNEDLLGRLGYADNPGRAFADFLGVAEESLDKNDYTASLTRTTPVNTRFAQLKPNVVVIMMEGFGSDLLRFNSARFNVAGELQKHLDADIVFRNFISGDMGTIGSIETVMLNIPKRPMAKAITQSRYSFNDFSSGAAVPYKKAGYETTFMYGGNSGWRNMQAFGPHAGFDTVMGEGSMDSRYPRNQWGVYDEFLFEEIYKKLSAAGGKSQFIFAMTTSNHPPYSLPASYRPLPLEISPELDREIKGDRKLAAGRFQTYQYANQKLGELLTRIKKSSLGSNTIIAVTGDHNFWSVFDYPQERFLRTDGVLFYLYVPETIRPAGVDADVFGSHVDIMPTLYNLSLSGIPYLSVGTNLFDRAEPHYAFNIDSFVLSREGAVQLRPESGAISFFGWDPTERSKLVPSAEQPFHQVLLKRYKAALAVTEYLVKHTGKKK